MKKYIGCDLGGTNLRAAVVDVETGAVLYQMSIATLAREGHDAVMKRMADLFLQVIQAAGMKNDEIGGVEHGGCARVACVDQPSAGGGGGGSLRRAAWMLESAIST